VLLRSSPTALSALAPAQRAGAQRLCALAQLGPSVGSSSAAWGQADSFCSPRDFPNL